MLQLSPPLPPRWLQMEQHPLESNMKELKTSPLYRQLEDFYLFIHDGIPTGALGLIESQTPTPPPSCPHTPPPLLAYIIKHLLWLPRKPLIQTKRTSMSSVPFSGMSTVALARMVFMAQRQSEMENKVHWHLLPNSKTSIHRLWFLQCSFKHVDDEILATIKGKLVSSSFKWFYLLCCTRWF